MVAQGCEWMGLRVFSNWSLSSLVLRRSLAAEFSYSVFEGDCHGSSWLRFGFLIVLSAVIVFVASSIMHMVLPYHKKDYNQLPDEARSAPPCKPPILSAACM